MSTTELPINTVLSQQTCPRILLVEDQKIIQLIHTKLLVNLGCQVDIASNGKEALALIDNNYDLVLLDLGLPDISGTQIAAEICARFHKNRPRMVALTAQSKSTVEAECLASGIDKVLTKPIDLNMLKNTIRLYCSNFNLSKYFS